MGWPNMFSTMLKPPPATRVTFPRTRLMLYFLTSLTSLLSIIFVVAAAALYADAVKNDLVGSFNSGYESLSLIALIPLAWSAVWSLIVFRGLLRAVERSSATISSSPTAGDEPEVGAIPSPTSSQLRRQPPGHSNLPAKHSKRQCGGCTCTRFHSSTRGVQPVALLVMELFLWPLLLNLGWVFGLLGSLDHLSWMRNRSCPTFYYDTDTLRFFCTATYRHLVGLEFMAWTMFGLSVLGHIALFIIACIVVHRWRGETGRRRTGAGPKRQSKQQKEGTMGQAEVLSEAERGRWIEMGRGADWDRK